MAKKIETENYVVEVKGIAETDWSGAVADDIGELIKKSSQDDIMKLKWQILQTEVELRCQRGDTQGALELVDQFEKDRMDPSKGKAYQAPLNVFKRDTQNGRAPYVGAHCFFGAFRDAAGLLDRDLYYTAKNRGKGGTPPPSDKHLRKCVKVVPNHVFMYRDGKKITNVDEIEGQNPVPPDVKGFARYEVIHAPFTFSYKMIIVPKGHFEDFLKDKAKVQESIWHSTFQGIGARRSANSGGWKITDMKVRAWSYEDEN